MRRLGALALAAAALLSGCGLGAGKSPGRVTLMVTRDFGTLPLRGSPLTFRAPGDETAMRALERSFKVTTRYGGGFVQSIDGLAGGHPGGRPFDWFFYINGIESSKGAAAVKLHQGDVEWWDRHDWGAAMRIPAVVGSFPEPFVHGISGRKLPVRVECAPDADAACQTVEKRLGSYGVLAGEAALGAEAGNKTLRIIVGRWAEVRRDYGSALLERGPAASGVYAKPTRDGRMIFVLDPQGRTVRTLGAGTGLIAATAYENLPPTWVVSGTDAAGVALAARNLTTDALHDRFAIAIGSDELPIALPQVGPPK